MGRWAGRLVRLVMVVAFVAANLYVGDWVVLRVRVSQGRRMGWFR